MTIEQIILIEPKVKSVLIIASKMKATQQNYNYLKRLLTPLVGFDAGKDQLKSSTCYEVAHAKLCKALVL